MNKRLMSLSFSLILMLCVSVVGLGQDAQQQQKPAAPTDQQNNQQPAKPEDQSSKPAEPSTQTAQPAQPSTDQSTQSPSTTTSGSATTGSQTPNSGSAVVPVETHNSAGSKPSGTGDRVTAIGTTASSPYHVPMLGLATFKKGKDTHMRINFTGEMAGSHANAFILPRQDGPTQIKVRFHDMKKMSSPDARLVLWAVGADNKIVKIGQIVNTGQRNETEIKGETALADFGLFVTAETKEDQAPTTPVIGTFEVVP